MSKTVEQLKHRAAELRQSPRLTNEHIDAVNNTAWELRRIDVRLAAEMSGEALELAARNNYLRGRAFALRNLGCCRQLIDQYQEAAQAFEESRQVFLHLQDDAGLASAINGLGILQRQAGKYEAALNEHSAALRLHEKLNDSVGVANILTGFGAINWHLGDYGQSLEYYYRALQTAISCRAFVSQAYTYINLGDVLWRVGDAEEAIRCSQKALALFRIQPDQRGESGTLNNLGAAHQSCSKHGEALRSYQRAAEIARQAHNIETQAEAEIGIGNVYCEIGDPEQAFVHLSDALQLSQSIGSLFYESQAMLGLGRTYRQVGNEQESIGLLERALEISQQLSAKETLHKAHLTLSVVYEQQNKTRAALFHHKAFHRLWQELHGTAAARRVQQLLLQIRFNQTPGDQRFLLGSGTDDNSMRALEKPGELSQQKLRQVEEFVYHHLEENIAVADLAAIANFSPRHFQDLFKQATGTTPHQFLIEQRVARAKHLLKTTALPLAEIAARCGFSSQSHLTAQFRLATGSSLRQFRRSPQKPGNS